MNPVSVALRGKGPFNLARRATNIIGSYGVTPAKMGRALTHFLAILNEFGCCASFPITAAVLERNPRVISKYQERGIEFAIHGYRHIDHCLLSQTEQLAQLEMAMQVFRKAGIQARGFRGPYLHANSDTLLALQNHGLAYDSSQSLWWDVLDGQETSAYRHVLGFYGALSATNYPSLPSLKGGVTCIPYSLPDDEALTNRLSLKMPEQMKALWLAVLHRSYDLGELFTLGLHPERTSLCQKALEAVLAEAQRFDPPVWIARLDEIANWWRARSEASVELAETENGRLRIAVMGPPGTTVLARGVQVEAPTRPWADDYQQVQATTFTIQGHLRPFIGLSPGASSNLYSFVRQQGYIVERGSRADCYAFYLDQARFNSEDQRPLLSQIEESDSPLLRFGRWPNGAHSALAITGDIDALTLWDYGLRFLGR